MIADSVATEQCVICWENIEETDADHAPVNLACGHIFGRSCIIESGKTDARCPICRKHTLPAEYSSYKPTVSTRLLDRLTNAVLTSCNFLVPASLIPAWASFLGVSSTLGVVLITHDFNDNYTNGRSLRWNVAAGIAHGAIMTCLSEDRHKIASVLFRSACLTACVGCLVHGLAAIASGILAIATITLSSRLWP
ncbi:RING finger protein [Endozoicomonas sp. ONNA2]|uniref:RING finger protein n=1 Tax=Endozoicomonas sp. ONNA2 TaxID=2828741 RepID=UPI00214786D0|nr:RING finger protein [Endozoicomonas sp. ONNA2]